MTIEEEVWQALVVLAHETKLPVRTKDINRLLTHDMVTIGEALTRLYKKGVIRKSIKGRDWILQK